MFPTPKEQVSINGNEDARGLNDLPNELLVEIFSNLNNKDLASVQQTNIYMNNVASYIWRKRVERIIGQPLNEGIDPHIYHRLCVALEKFNFLTKKGFLIAALDLITPVIREINTMGHEGDLAVAKTDRYILDTLELEIHITHEYRRDVEADPPHKQYAMLLFKTKDGKTEELLMDSYTGTTPRVVRNYVVRKRGLRNIYFTYLLWNGILNPYSISMTIKLPREFYRDTTC